MYWYRMPLFLSPLIDSPMQVVCVAKFVVRMCIVHSFPHEAGVAVHITGGFPHSCCSGDSCHGHRHPMLSYPILS